MTYGKLKTNIEPNKKNKERNKLKKQSKILLSWVTMEHHSKIEIISNLSLAKYFLKSFFNTGKFKAKIPSHSRAFILGER